LLRNTFICVCTLGLLASLARAETKYSFKENVRVGQKLAGMMDYQEHEVITDTTGSDSSTSDVQTHENMKVLIDVTQVKDGSATQMQIDVDPASFEAEKKAGEAEVKTPLPFIGRPVTLTRMDDGSVSNDFKTADADKNAISLANDTLNGWLGPDEDFFPAQPVAVGDSWDVSAKYAKHAELGPGDQALTKCHLDWVKDVNGKQMAQITASCGIIRVGDANVEADDASSCTLLVDMAASQIVKSDVKGTVTYSNPKTEATQRSGKTDYTFHCEAHTVGATTQP
jgi:hypothetical protein